MQKTPNLKPQVMDLSPEYVNKLLGTDFDKEKIKGLLEKMMYGVEFEGGRVRVSIPAYRTDVLHAMDLVEDIAIAGGYENFKPELPGTAGIGKKDPVEKSSDMIRELMLGFGFHEVMTMILTNKNDLFKRMRLDIMDGVETENPVSSEHGVVRTWLLPSMMATLENNKNREYPQQIFEIGSCVSADGKAAKKLSFVIADSKANFSEMKSHVLGLLNSLGYDCIIKKLGHRSFIEGRCASITTGKEVGFFGEIHPKVLENFNLEIPVTGCELDLSMLV